MPHAFITPGTTFGLLRVVKQAGLTPIGERLYLCTCACGSKRKLRTSILRGRKYYSCGCFQKRHPALRNNNKRKGAPFVERNQIMFYLALAGHKKTAIAKRFNISPSTVHAILRRMKVTA